MAERITSQAEIWSGFRQIGPGMVSVEVKTTYDETK